jgi:hypothetical protein
VVIKKQFFGGYESTEEGSQFKASIVWDHPSPIHLNHFNHIHVSTLMPVQIYHSY